MRKINEEGLNLIKFFETCSLKATKAIPAEPYYTIGWGHYGPEVEKNQTITQKEADDLLVQDVAKIERYVNDKAYVPVTDELNSNQFSALVSFTYNCGPGSLRSLCNGRTIKEIEAHITAYNKSFGIELAGLTRRRYAELNLFRKEDDEDMTQERFNEMMDNYLAEKNKLPPSAWSESDRQWAEENGIIFGDSNGDKQYKGFCTREQMVTFMRRVVNLLNQ